MVNKVSVLPFSCLKTAKGMCQLIKLSLNENDEGEGEGEGKQVNNTSPDMGYQEQEEED